MAKPEPVGVLGITLRRWLKSKIGAATIITLLLTAILLPLLEDRYGWWSKLNTQLDNWGVPDVLTSWWGWFDTYALRWVAFGVVLLAALALLLLWDSRNTSKAQLWVCESHSKKGHELTDARPELSKDKHLKAMSKWRHRAEKDVERAFGFPVRDWFSNMSSVPQNSIEWTRGDQDWEGHIVKHQWLTSKLEDLAERVRRDLPHIPSEDATRPWMPENRLLSLLALKQRGEDLVEQYDMILRAMQNMGMENPQNEAASAAQLRELQVDPWLSDVRTTLTEQELAIFDRRKGGLVNVPLNAIADIRSLGTIVSEYLRRLNTICEAAQRG
jgi:hypothetical protein